jgi:hypothetical protein
LLDASGGQPRFKVLPELEDGERVAGLGFLDSEPLNRMDGSGG